VNDLRQVLKEVSRVLKPAGKFVFVDHGASPLSYWYFLQKTLTAVTKHFTGNCHYNRRIGEALEQAGFSIIEMKHPPERYKPLIYNYQGVAVPVNRQTLLYSKHES
jgi:ubiquinone/menaquinone biosynthesis C-methylase UbiE